MTITLNSGGSRSRRPRGGGSAFGGGPSFSGGSTSGSGSADDPYRVSRGSGGSSSGGSTSLRDLQKDLSRSGEVLTSEEQRAVARGEDVSRLVYARSAAAQDARLRRQGVITVSEGFQDVYASQQPDFARVRREQAAAEGFGAQSVPYSTELGEGVDAVKYSVQTGPIASFEDPNVLYMRDLQRQQIASGLVPTGLQRGAGRAAGRLREFANVQYSAADPGSVFGGVRVLAGDVAVIAQDPLQRYAFGDKRLGRQLTLGYTGGLLAGGLLGVGVTRVSAASAARFGVPAGIRTAKASQVGLSAAGGLLGAGYVASSSPQQIGRDLPGFAAFGFGIGRGYNLGFQGVSRGPTTMDYLGLRQSAPRGVPRQGVYRVPGERISFVSTQRGAERVYNVFGRLTTASSSSSTAFSGAGIVGGSGERYVGPYLSSRTTQFGRGLGTVRSSVRGQGFLDFDQGMLLLSSPGAKSTALGLVTSRVPRRGGGELVGSAFAYRSPSGLRGATYKDLLSPDITLRLPTIQSNRVVRGGRTLFEATGLVPTQETYFSLSPVSQQGPRGISPFLAESLFTAAGIQNAPGLPRTRVARGSSPRTYFDPTGGLLASVSVPRSPATVEQPTVRVPSRSRRGVPRVSPGFDVPLVSFTGSSPLLSFAIPQGARSGFRSGGFQELLFDPGSRIPVSSVESLPFQSSRLDPLRGVAESFDTSSRLTRQPSTGLFPIPVPPRSPPRPPPGLFGPPIPLFGVGGAGVSPLQAAGRDFEYASSLVSGLLGIEGEEVDIITGLEIRPKRRRKKK